MATNPQIKRAGATDEYTPVMIQELAKCQNDPVYFIKTYVKVQHPIKGSIPFALFEYQEQLVRHLQDNRFACVLLGRQMGKTATIAMFLLWYACFNDDATLLVASKNQSHALEIAARIRFAFEELPNWIKPGVKYYNRHNLEFVNGSRIISEATTEKTGRGLSVTKIYLDELSWVNLRIQEELWASLSPTLSTGGSAIISSTPNGDTDLFATLWRGAMSGINGFAPFHVDWRKHPERNETYWNTIVSQIGLLKARQEVSCEFLSSDALLINSLKLINIKSSPHIFENMGFKFWKKEEEIGGLNKTYLVSLDPATGDGSDFSAIEVFEFPSLFQIAEFRTNDINIPLIYAKLKWVLNYLSQPIDRGRAEVLWTFERNGVGEAISALYFTDESQPEHAELFSDHDTKLGVFTSGRNKIVSCLTLKTLVEKAKNGFELNSDILIHELKNFVAKGGSYAAKNGSTDDTVMATVGIVRLLKRLSDYNDDAFARMNEQVAPDYEENADPMPMLI